MYFKVLSITWGALTVLRGPILHLLGRRWPRFGLKLAYPEKRPFLTWLAAVATLILIAVTWTVHVKSDEPWSLIVTLFVTLSLFRTSQVLFNYTKFRGFAVRVTAERPGYRIALNVAAAVVGITLILLGIFVY